LFKRLKEELYTIEYQKTNIKTFASTNQSKKLRLCYKNQYFSDVETYYKYQYYYFDHNGCHACVCVCVRVTGSTGTMGQTRLPAKATTTATRATENGNNKATIACDMENGLTTNFWKQMTLVLSKGENTPIPTTHPNEP